MSEHATLTIDGKSYELPIVRGSEDELALDVAKLRAQTGHITYDPGYGNTGACNSAITFIDGERGILRYRGYPIEQLAEHSSFLEVAYLLIKGDLPAPGRFKVWADNIRYHTMLNENFKLFFSALPRDAHPMAVCAAAIGALSTFYQDSLDPDDLENVRASTHRLLAKMPTIAAYAHKTSLGQPLLYPRNDLSFAANYLRMLFGTPCEEYSIDPVIEKAIDVLWILHADHEQNCSTSTVRLVGSSQANLYASIAAGISALWGPLHGGANQAVIEMLEHIAAGGESAQQFLDRVKRKEEGVRLMGFGHRVYKNYDPRAKIIKRWCDRVLERTGTKSPLLEIAMEIEERALGDDYFIERKLYPNVDFYSGIIYNAIGVPVNMFTVMFAIGRLPGWIAHWLELHQDPEFRIGRPRQIYTGPTMRDYLPIDRR
jgi:citrate synthase